MESVEVVLDVEEGVSRPVVVVEEQEEVEVQDEIRALAEKGEVVAQKRSQLMQLEPFRMYCVLSLPHSFVFINMVFQVTLMEGGGKLKMNHMC